MKSIYQLQIYFDASIETFESVSALLGIKPEIQDHFLGKIPCDWVYKVVQEDDDIYFDFINEFLNILERAKEEVQKLEDKLTFEDNYVFFKCNNGCEKLQFELAFEYDFKCPECGSVMKQVDSEKEKKQIRKRISEYKKFMEKK